MDIRAVVLSIDKENERYSLGIKQLEKDPWDGITDRFQRGQLVTGTVTNVTSFGVFLELGEGIEGLIHISELGEVKAQNCKAGDELSAVITNIDRKGRKMSLSVKELKEMGEKEDVASFMESQEKAASPLAEQLKEHWSPTPPPDEAATEGSQPVQAGSASNGDQESGADPSLPSPEPETET